MGPKMWSYAHLVGSNLGNGASYALDHYITNSKSHTPNRMVPSKVLQIAFGTRRILQITDVNKYVGDDGRLVQ